MALKKSKIYSSLWASCDELLGGMDAEIVALKANLAKMQELLTGNTRLLESS